MGLDFYGDNLCSSAEHVATHPDHVRELLAASLKGWAFALTHKTQTADLILERYSRSKSREALLFEAAQSEALIQPQLIATRRDHGAVRGRARVEIGPAAVDVGVSAAVGVRLGTMLARVDR
jgi:hypothetical protein